MLFLKQPFRSFLSFSIPVLTAVSKSVLCTGTWRLLSVKIKFSFFFSILRYLQFAFISWSMQWTAKWISNRNVFEIYATPLLCPLTLLKQPQTTALVKTEKTIAFDMTQLFNQFGILPSTTSSILALLVFVLKLTTMCLVAPCRFLFLARSL